MAKQRELTKRQRKWLHKRHGDLDLTVIAQKLGCCVDTLKRILMREGLQYFAGAKYQFKSCHEKEALSSRIHFGDEEEGYREPSLPKPPFDISNFFLWEQSYA